VASGTATLLRYRKLAGEKATFVKGILELGRLSEIGDSAAKEAIITSANYLAKATLILINSLNPDIFIFAGGMAGLGDVLLDPVREFIRSSTFKMVGENTPIVAGKLGIYSGCFGSAWLALSGTPVLPSH